MAEENKNESQSIFKAMGELFKVKLEESLVKARSAIAQQEDDAVYQKAVHRDFTFSTGVNGAFEKASSITFEHEKQMARKNTIVAGIIKTRQNQAAPFSKPVKEKHETGFRMALKDEEAKLQEIIKNLKEGKIDDKAKAIISNNSDLKKAVEAAEDFTVGMTDKEIERMAQDILGEMTGQRIKELTQFMVNCGKVEDRPFESKKWNFDAFLRAFVENRYTYDWVAVEKIPEESNPDKIHHIVPVDSTTIRYASPTLATYNNAPLMSAANILYPEKELEKLEERDALELDPEKLENGDYKFVQKIRGLIVRAFTADEMAVASANPTTDIYTNGYSVSELELLANTVSAHIFTEHQKRAYFTNGFSAKGILHIKAPLNRRKLEALRIKWKHMVSGPKNSFQTPIFAGMDEVQWIPLNQGNIDQEFNNWMNYLIKVICMIYQIDPSEIGFGMKDEGKGGISGDNTEEKFEHSKSKGFVPLMRFIENFINTHIIDYIDADYKLEFVGLSDESNAQSLARQEKEVKFKKSLNEVRAEDGLPPIPGCDNLILDPVYFQWFSQFSEEGKANMQEMQQQQQEQGIDDQISQDSDIQDQQTQDQNQAVDDQIGQDSAMADQEASQAEQGVLDTSGEDNTLGDILPADEQKPMKKSLSIEYYTLPDEE